MSDPFTRETATTFLIAFDIAAMLFLFFVNTWYLLLLVSAGLEMREHLRRTQGEARRRILASQLAPRISVLVPAHNEQETIADSTRSFLSLHYAQLEVVVINDGSSDATQAVLTDAFDLIALRSAYRTAIPTAPIREVYRSLRYPELIVIDKESGGKADALNAGISVASGELVCAIDADTIIEADALQRMVRPFLERSDVVAAGGTIRIANEATVEQGRISSARVPRQYLPGIQAVEYLRAFMFGRLGWNRLGGNLIISGAFGLFRRESVLSVGGYQRETVGEDIELVVRLRRAAYEKDGPRRVEFIPDPVAWTEVPGSLRALGSQRDRWHRGLADTLWRHRRVMLRPSYGGLGLVAYPYFVFVELLAPVVEAAGLVALGLGIAFELLAVEFVILFFLFAYGYGLILSLASVAFENATFVRYGHVRDVARLAAWSALEHFGYRQLTVYWRLRGLVGWMRGGLGWGDMERKGFGPRDGSK